MHVVLAVFKRNLASYLSGVLGYLFMAAFLIGVALAAFNDSFFANNLANPDQLSLWFPFLLVGLIPAITMSSWADERRFGTDELLFVLQRHWRSLGKTLDPEDFTDAQAIASITRITRGNFRLLERLFPQIERVLKINELDTITNDVIEAAASTLVIGTT